MISVIIPYMEAFAEKRDILKRCTQSLKGHDEVIVVSNWQEGYAKPINKGLAIARGDYLVVMNDDIVMTAGNLKELCDPDAVTSPTINGQKQSFWGCCFCLPRWVYEKTGGLDERFRISYYDDDSFYFTLRTLGIPINPVESVNFDNPNGGGTTLHTFADNQVFFEENRQKFIDLWGATPEEMYRRYPN